MSHALVHRITVGVTVALCILAAVLVVQHIPRTISIFLIAAFIAFGTSPVVRRLERRMPRPLAIALIYIILLGALVVLALVIVPIAYVQVLALVGHTGDYVAASQDAVAKVELLLRSRLGDRVALPTFSEMQAEVGQRVAGAFSVMLASIGTIVLNTVNAIVIGASALILSIFLLTRGREIRRGVLTVIPHSRRAKTNALLVEVASIFGHFVAGQLALSVIVGVVVWLLLAPAHFAFALLVAVICGLGYAVPFVGMLVAQVVAALLALPQGTTMLIYVTIAIFATARIADSILVPRIMADAVGVSPIAVMFAVFAGGELFGLWGLILAIPTAALARVLFTYFVLPWIVHMQKVDAATPHEPDSFPEVVVTVSER